jgi:hypothetical protein
VFTKPWLGFVLAIGLVVPLSAEDIIVRVAPPRAVVEHRPSRPGREYVWVNGYHRWDGSRHVWVEGRWDRPPHQRAHWVAHHWVKRRGGWVLVEGHWS